MILHLLYAPRTVKGANKIEVIEDCPVLREIPVEIQTKKAVKRIYTAPDGEEIPFERLANGVISFKVPRLHIHAMTVLEYEN